MLKKNNNLQIYKKGLYFLSLGGIGEIGANCYLYCCDDKWIMIDLGLSFADEQFPGVDLLVPKINFIEDIKDNLEAIIISHGHEDHAGHHGRQGCGGTRHTAPRRQQNDQLRRRRNPVRLHAGTETAGLRAGSHRSGRLLDLHQHLQQATRRRWSSPDASGSPLFPYPSAGRIRK